MQTDADAISDWAGNQSWYRRRTKNSKMKKKNFKTMFWFAETFLVNRARGRREILVVASIVRFFWSCLLSWRALLRVERIILLWSRIGVLRLRLETQFDWISLIFSKWHKMTDTDPAELERSIEQCAATMKAILYVKWMDLFTYVQFASIKRS